MNNASPALSRAGCVPSPDARAIAWLIACFTLLRLLMAATAPLLPQEAYYWTWSRHLDASYFDHPPLASYAIALSTSVFGQTVFGIKLAAVLWSLGWNVLWAKLIHDMFRDRRLTFWSLLALNLTPLYELYGFGPSPDGPLLFFWLATILSIWHLSLSGQARWWYLAGACMGLSWLGKYAGVLLAPVVLLYLLTSAQQRHWLKTPHPYLAFALAIAVFSPVLFWNFQHDWASLAFQSSRRVGEMGGLKPRFFVVLVFTQLLVLTPYLFTVSLAAAGRALRSGVARQLDDPSRLLALSALVPLLLFTAVSFRSNAKINWLMPAWWSLIILAMRYLLAQESKIRQLIWGLRSSAGVLLLIIAMSQVPNLPIPGDFNSWSGWKEAAARVDQLEARLQAQGEKTFVFSPTYKTSSLIWFYNAGQDRTYAQDIYGEKALQYDYFPRQQDLKGATGLLLVSDQRQSRIDLDKIRPFFDSIERIDVVETSAFQHETRRIEIYRGTNYHGHPSIQKQ